MSDNIKLFIPPGTAKHLVVCEKTHEAVVYFTQKYKMRVIETTQYLLTKVLREEFCLKVKPDDTEEGASAYRSDSKVVKTDMSWVQLQGLFVTLQLRY